VAFETRLRVVGVDLEGDERERVERGRLDDGHVVGGLDGRAGDVRARARADVGHPGVDALAQRADEACVVESAQQLEGVAAADEDGLGTAERRRRVGCRVYRLASESHPLEHRARRGRALVPAPHDGRVGHVEDGADAGAEEVFDGPLGVRQRGRAGVLRVAEEKKSHCDIEVQSSMRSLKLISF
jgi:hypothetical protein